MKPVQDDPDVCDRSAIDALVGDALDGEVSPIDRLRHAVAETLGREWERRLRAARATRIEAYGFPPAEPRPRQALMARLTTLRERYPSVVARHPLVADSSDDSISQIIEDVGAVTGDRER